ncbi:uncharacterized protein J3R85_019060 [Psidium guajava]|nr:uncharacterized protein J3R85_019060 [Psidium guajava]
MQQRHVSRWSIVRRRGVYSRRGSGRTPRRIRITIVLPNRDCLARTTTLCYGHASCHAGIPKPECTACVRYAADFLGNRCPMCFGAQTQIQSCTFRYERYPFIENK